MKKITLALLTFTQISCNGQTNDELTFKVQYKPEKKYSNTIKQTSYSETTYSGSEEFLTLLKDKGVQNPTITNKKTTIESISKTGKSKDGTNFPLTIEIIKTTSSAEKKDIPDGLLIYGHGSNGNMPTLDSIVSKNIDEHFKKTLLQAMQSTFSQLNLPERKVKVGEKFSTETPLSIPVADMTIDMIITTNYKLLNITNDIADFDVSSVYTMKTSVTKYTIHATGNSKGKLLYDISNNYYLKYQTDTELEMNTKLDKFNLNIKNKSSYTQISTISKNTSM